MNRVLAAGCAAVLVSIVLSAEQAKKPASPPARPPARTAAAGHFSVVEATIPEMQAAMKAGRVTSHEIVRQYLARIGTYEDRLHAAITVNPKALEIADERDRERAQGRIRGPLHGIPIALKDNVLTTFIRTTGGALAFENLVPPYDATLTKNLVDAGAIIIAKTGMTELANWVAGAPTPMPGNYNAVGGQGYNPYDPRKDPREATFDGRPALGTGGSSSGVGTAANFWAGNVGTETSGSILSPSNANMLAGIKPTVGRISRYGVIPITADQDTAGPMAKSVSDVAIMFGAMESASPDPNDAATTKCTPAPNRDYTAYLKRDGLKGARIGIPRAYYYDPLPADLVPPPAEGRGRGAAEGRGGRGGGRGNGGGLNDAQKAAMAGAIAVLKQQGAVVVDPADIPSIVDKEPTNNFLRWGQCSGANDGRGHDEDCSVDLKYGMKRDFNAWLKTLGAAAPVKTLGELIEWNRAHEKAGAIKYGQSNLEISDEMDVERDKARYEADRAKDIRLGGTHGIDEIMKADRLDAILFPGANGASIAAKPGYPTVTVPFALVPNDPTPPFPAGFNAKPGPMGVSFTGMACSEPRLIELAYSFEQATKKRVPPPSVP
ncbi:MAG TPA: amidase family protein [Vicinamibacterales bacterium]|nr:amidase family protein [Vicinamibacterales bacterium]